MKGPIVNHRHSHGQSPDTILRWNRAEGFRRINDITFGRLGEGKVWTRVEEGRRIRSPEVNMM